MSIDPIELLSRPIAFQRAYVTITESITAALFLSQALYWTPRGAHGNKFYKSQEEWNEETGMTRYEQEGARKTLRNLGILEEEYERLTHRLWFCINKDRVRELLVEKIGNAAPKPPKEKPLSPMRENHIGESGKPAVGSVAFPQSSNTENTTENTTERPSPTIAAPTLTLVPAPKRADELFSQEVVEQVNAPSLEGMNFATWFATKLLPASFKTSPKRLREWAEIYDKMLRIDGRTKKQVAEVTVWARNDYFEKKNFLSPAKLRKNKKDTDIKWFDYWTEQMKEEAAKTAKSGPKTVPIRKEDMPEVVDMDAELIKYRAEKAAKAARLAEEAEQAAKSA